MVMVETVDTDSYGLASFNGAQDWARTPLYLTENVAVGGGNYQRPRVFVGPRGMLAANAKEIRTSPEYGPTTPCVSIYL